MGEVAVAEDKAVAVGLEDLGNHECYDCLHDKSYWHVVVDGQDGQVEDAGRERA